MAIATDMGVLVAYDITLAMLCVAVVPRLLGRFSGAIVKAVLMLLPLALVVAVERTEKLQLLPAQKVSRVQYKFSYNIRMLKTSKQLYYKLQAHKK